ncbi:MAG: T9SS type A sorting domain-containing protein [Flavobacteriales bacterium]|nr:T9SS type A sorting domain-containing protein [Flavobacteriales bacterium]
MTMTRSLFCSVGICCAPLCTQAQGLDRVYQTGLLSVITSVLQGPSGHLYLATLVPADNSFYQPSVIREVDGSGEIVNEWSLSVAGNETTIVNDLHMLSDSSIIAAGQTSGCDLGPFQGFVTKYASGIELWSRTFGVGPIKSVASNDTILALADSDGLLLTSLDGDSLLLVESVGSYVSKVRSTIEGFVIMGAGGASQIHPDGTVANTLTDVNIRDLFQLSSGKFLALTIDSLLELNSALERTGIGRALTIEWSRQFLEDQGDIFIFSADSLQFVEDGLNIGNAIALEPSEGLAIWDAMISNGELVMVGSFSCGARSAALRTMLVQGSPSTLSNDIALRGAMVGSFNYTLSTGGSGSITLSGNAWISAWLVNVGDEALQHATVDYVDLFSNCGMAGRWEPLDDLDLQPGDSIEVSLGPLYVYHWIPNGEPVDMSICIWAADVNRRLDRDHTNNRACATFEIPVGVENLSQGTTFELNPNPTSGRVRINHAFIEKTAIVVVDSQGRIVLRPSVPLAVPAFDLDVSGLGQGVYTVTLLSDGYKWSKVLVVE